MTFRPSRHRRQSVTIEMDTCDKSIYINRLMYFSGRCRLTSVSADRGVSIRIRKRAEQEAHPDGKTKEATRSVKSDGAQTGC
jgi:hypothetical protein